MASGVKVAASVLPLINSMRVKRNNDVAGERIRIMTLSINKEIEVEKTIKEDELANQACVYDVVRGLMKPKECKYIVYDCHYEVEDGAKEDLVFIMWSDDDADMKMKMPYASSKSYIKKASAAKHEFELHGMDEITPKEFACGLEKVAKTKVKCLEGMDLCHC